MIHTVIIPVLNRYDLLARAIESVGDVERMIIIDNGDAIDGAAIVKAVKRGARIIKSPSNLGVATSWNLGIKMSPHANGWLLLNSDAYFVDEGFRRFSALTTKYGVVQAGDPSWCCTWISEDAIERVGLFCERFYPAYMEDVDWERRARILGVTFAYCENAVAHDNSSTISADPKLAEQNQRTHAANHAYYAYRWNQARDIPPDAEWRLSTRRGNDWS